MEDSTRCHEGAKQLRKERNRQMRSTGVINQREWPGINIEVPWSGSTEDFKGAEYQHGTKKGTASLSGTYGKSISEDIEGQEHNRITLTYRWTWGWIMEVFEKSTVKTVIGRQQVNLRRASEWTWDVLKV